MKRQGMDGSPLLSAYDRVTGIFNEIFDARLLTPALGALLFYCCLFTQRKFPMRWMIFVLFGMVPSDVLCPVSVHEFLHADLWLDVFGYTLVWLEMIWVAVRPTQCSETSSRIS